MVTFGDMAEALYQLRRRYGLYYTPSEREIFEVAKKLSEVKVADGTPTTTDGIPPKDKSLGILPTIL